MSIQIRSRLAGLGLVVFMAVPLAAAQEGEDAKMQAHPQSIQPETTLSLSATGSVERAPDLAFVTTGVETEAKTAQAAMKANRENMNGVFEALAAAGIAERDIQTANFSLQPVYEYVEEDKRNRRVLTGYGVSNQVTARVRDLDTLGETLDALVEAGGNTFSGLRFALDDPSAARNEARMSAMETLLARAELYAKAAGYEVGRIVTLSERGGDAPAPRPMAVMARSATAESAPTPIASGEIGYEITVNATFELTR